MRARGITVSLGADGAACNNRLDMFEEMRLAAVLQAMRHAARASCPRATCCGWPRAPARARSGSSDEIGSLEVGKRADLIVVDRDRPHLAPGPDPYSTLVYAARGSDVRTTIVDGEVLVDDGRAGARRSGAKSSRRLEQRRAGCASSRRLRPWLAPLPLYNALAVSATASANAQPAERSSRVLAALVREYIASGEPVPSSLLVTRGRARRVVGDGPEHPRAARGRGLRPAAAHLGRPHPDRPRLPLLRRPAARVEALRARPPSAVEARLRRDSAGAAGRLACCSQASHVVSQASRHVGFALRPAHEAAVFDRVEFVPLGGTRVLVVIVAAAATSSRR